MDFAQGQDYHDSRLVVSRTVHAPIRPISDLRNTSREIESYCRESGEPVFISRNGEDDLVVMSQAARQASRRTSMACS
jgi:hypothetical protein